MELKFQSNPQQPNLFHKYWVAEQKRLKRRAVIDAVDNLKHPTLKSWSWQEIISLYRVYAKMFNEYEGYKNRCHIPDSIRIDYPDEENLFVMRFMKDVKRLSAQVSVLDAEIARRNSLIGVMG